MNKKQLAYKYHKDGYCWHCLTFIPFLMSVALLFIFIIYFVFLLT